MTTSEIATVLAWHDALNEQDFDTLMTLSSDDIEVGDAKGAAQGHAALLDWVRSADIKAEPGRMYVHNGVVVVEQEITSVAGNTASSSVCSDCRTPACCNSSTSPVGIRKISGETYCSWAPKSRKSRASEWTVRPYFKSPNRNATSSRIRRRSPSP